MVSGVGFADGGDGGDGGDGCDGGDGGAMAVVQTSTAWRPIGISPAITKPPADDWWQGNKWPPADWEAPPNTGWPITNASSFSHLAWSPYYYSLAMLGEFTQTTGPNNLTWDRISLPPIPTGTQLTDEINELIQLMDYRPGVMAEALMQRDNMLVYWCGLLMFGQSSHPWTYRLMEIALRVGQFQVMHYKRMANKANPTDFEGRGRPRPSQLSPALMPPLEVPGHASYPSGHATESYLISKCLARVMPAAASTQYDAADPHSTPLQRLAQRVARNREVLGLHYPSDSEAGRQLAEATYGILIECPTIKNLVVPNALAEWA